jgi:hypothetical protein
MNNAGAGVNKLNKVEILVRHAGTDEAGWVEDYIRPHSEDHQQWAAESLNADFNGSLRPCEQSRELMSIRLTGLIAEDKATNGVLHTATSWVAHDLLFLHRSHLQFAGPSARVRCAYRVQVLAIPPMLAVVMLSA